MLHQHRNLALYMLSIGPRFSMADYAWSEVPSQQGLHWYCTCNTGPSILGVRPCIKCRQLGDAAISAFKCQMVG